MRQKRPAFSKQEVLSAVPVRNERVHWDLNDEGEVVLHIPRRQDRLGRILNRIFAAPEHRRLVLDELGSQVWQLCDGEHSVEMIIRSLARTHKLSRREVELSLSVYLKQLAQRQLVGLVLRR
ncbi:MAG: PqqD family protein [Armatimonadetes bacterium]|nr:PqqD family protein [Armatimonadota bacterium]